MSDWLNGRIDKFEKVITIPVEEEAYLKMQIPEDAIITAETRTLKTIRIKYVLTNELTAERIRQLNENIKPIKLDRKNKIIDNTSNKQKRINCIDTVMAIINVADFHLNRRIWGKAGYDSDYTLKMAEKVFKDSIDEIELRLRACPYRIEKIIFNTAGDFLNSDTILNTTTKGTPQINDGNWQESYMLAQELLSYAMLKLSNIAPVYHFYVAGNHDQMAGWYLVSWLKARFKDIANIHVDDNPKTRQYVEYGKNLIIMAHGDNEGKRAIDLPYTEPGVKQKLADKTNIEVLIGHGHKPDVTYKNGVRLEMLSCACPIGDQWTYDMGYEDSKGEITIMYYNNDSRIQQDTINVRKFINDEN